MTLPLVPSPVRIVDRYADGEDATHYTFELDGAETLADGIARVEPGQFFLLSVPGHGDAPFTYVSLPNASGRFDALVRHVGHLTNALRAVEPDRVLGVRGPFGRGWPSAAFRAGRVLLVAGGCGLAPLAPAIDVFCRRADPHRAVLVYGSRTPELQVLARERAFFAAHLPVIEMFDQPVGPGSLRGTPADFLLPALAELGGLPDYTLVCGPEPMMEATALALAREGVAEASIYLSIERRMHCGVGLCGHCYVANEYACKDGPTYRFDALRALEARSQLRRRSARRVLHC